MRPVSWGQWEWDWLDKQVVWGQMEQCVGGRREVGSDWVMETELYVVELVVADIESGVWACAHRE